MMLQPSSTHSVMAVSTAAASVSSTEILRTIWSSARPRFCCMPMMPWSWV